MEKKKLLYRALIFVMHRGPNMSRAGPADEPLLRLAATLSTPDATLPSSAGSPPCALLLTLAVATLYSPPRSRARAARRGRRPRHTLLRLCLHLLSTMGDFPPRVDTSGAFQVEVDVQSYLTIADGRKVYKRGKTWSFVVDRGLSVEHIKQAVEEKFQWSNDQRMTIWYGSGDDVVPLISESEIAQLFDRCAISRIIRFGVTIENKRQNNGPTLVTVDDENDEPVHTPFFAWPKQAWQPLLRKDQLSNVLIMLLLLQVQ